MKIIRKIHLAVTIYSQRSVARTKLTESFKDARKLAIPASRLTEAFPVFYLRLISLSRPLSLPLHCLFSRTETKHRRLVWRCKENTNKTPSGSSESRLTNEPWHPPRRHHSPHPPSNGVGSATYDVTRAQRYTYVEIELEGKAVALEEK